MSVFYHDQNIEILISDNNLICGLLLIINIYCFAFGSLLSGYLQIEETYSFKNFNISLIGRWELFMT